MTVIAFRFPGAGYRNTTGVLTNVGSNGYFWSSSPYESGSTNAGNLFFGSDGRLIPVNNNNRVNGFAVRCVSELTILYTHHFGPEAKVTKLPSFGKEGCP